MAENLWEPNWGHTKGESYPPTSPGGAIRAQGTTESGEISGGASTKKKKQPPGWLADVLDISGSACTLIIYSYLQHPG